MSTFRVKARAYNMLEEWNGAREEQKRGRELQETKRKTWAKPPAGWIKINTDASYFPESTQVGVGVLFGMRGVDLFTLEAI